MAVLFNDGDTCPVPGCRRRGQPMKAKGMGPHFSSHSASEVTKEEVTTFLRDRGWRACTKCMAEGKKTLAPIGDMCAGRHGDGREHTPRAAAAAGDAPRRREQRMTSAKHEIAAIDDAEDLPITVGQWSERLQAAAVEALGIHVPSMVHIPRGFVQDVARAFLSVVQRLGSLDAQQAVQAIGTLLLHPPRYARQVSQEMRERLQAFRRGDFDELLNSARRAARRTGRQSSTRQPKTTTDPSDEERDRLARRIVAVVHRSGPCGRAVALLTPSAGSALKSEAKEEAVKLHPRGELPTDCGVMGLPVKTSAEAVAAAVRSFPKESSPGRGGLRPEHLRAIMEAQGVGTQVREVLTFLMNEILAGKVHDALNEGELLLLSKAPKKGFRPIVLLPVLRRLASKCALAATKEDVQKVMVDAHQFGVGFPGGVESVAATTVRIVEKGGKVRSVDFANAFNSIKRTVAYEEVAEHFPQLAAYAFAMLSKPLILHLRDAPGEKVEATCGGPQGDPFSPFVFAMTLARMRRKLKARCHEAGIAFCDWWYVDDGVVVVKEEHAAEFERLLREEGAEVGCVLKFFLEAPEDHLRVPLGDNRKAERVGECAGTLKKIADALVNEPQVALSLIKACAAPAVKLRLLARCRKDIDWEDVDKTLQECMQTVVGGSRPLGPAVWAQCQLEVARGGCGIQSMKTFAPAFYEDAVGKREKFVAEACEEAGLVVGADFSEAIAADKQPAQEQGTSVEDALQAEWLSAAEKGSPEDVMHAHDIAHPWTGDFLLAHPKAPGCPTRIHPEVFRRALRNRLGLVNVVAPRNHAKDDSDDDSDSSSDSSSSSSSEDELTSCTRCKAPMAPEHRHAIGCVGQRNTRHNAVRNVIVDYVREAGTKCLKEQSMSQLRQLTGRAAPERQEAQDALIADGEQPKGNCERPCDILILHRISDAPTTISVYDVTMVLADASKGVGGLHPQGREEPEWQRGLRLARERKDLKREEIEGLGAAFVPLVFSANGRPDDGTVNELSSLSKDWALAHGTTPGEAMRILRMRISCVTHRWNGEILRSLCGSSSGNLVGRI